MTVVEFLLEKYKSQNTLLFAEDFEQAKEIEKKQREKDFIEGYKKRAKLSGLPFDEASKSSAKELFNKTLK